MWSVLVNVFYETFHTIPDERPDIPMLENINSPHDLRSLAHSQLRQVADELREFLLYIRRVYLAVILGQGLG